LYDNFYIHNGLRQSDVLSQLPFSFVLEQLIWKIHGNQVELVDVNVLGNNVDTMKIITEILNDASKEVGLEVNEQETIYVLLSSRQNAGQNHVIRIANSSIFKRVTVQNFGKTLQIKI
jgi:hypothetical protein